MLHVANCQICQFDTILHLVHLKAAFLILAHYCSDITLISAEAVMDFLYGVDRNQCFYLIC